MNKLLYGVAYYDEYMPYDRLDQDVESRQALYEEAVTVSEQLMNAIGTVIARIEEMTNDGEAVFEKSLW